MAGRMYYYNLGGGNSPKSWIGWVISLAVFAGLVVLLLPFIGAVFVGILVLVAVMAVAGFVLRWWMTKKLEKEIAKGEEEAVRRTAQPDDGTPASAGSRGLEIQEAVVVSETGRRTRRDAERDAADGIGFDGRGNP